MPWRSPVQFPGDPETYPFLDTSHAWVVGWDWTIGTNKTNSLVWGQTVANLGFPVTYNPQGPNQYGWDGNPTGGFLLSGIYGGAGGAQSRYFPIPVLRDDFTWEKGRHSFTFGGSFKYPSPHFSHYSDYNGPGLGLGGGVTGLTDADPSGWKFRPDDLDRNQTSLTLYDSAMVFGLGRFENRTDSWNYTAAGSGGATGHRLAAQVPILRDRGVLRGYVEDYAGRSPLPTDFVTRDYTVPYEVHGIEAVQSESLLALHARSYRAERGRRGR